MGGCLAFPAMFATTMGAGVSAVQAGTASFIGGELESAEATEMHVLYEIIQEVLVEELAFEVTAARAGENYAYIHTRETQGRTIRITLERKSPIVTKLNIRVGWFGDQPMSRIVLGAIQSRLPAPPHRYQTLEEMLRMLNGDREGD
jgi:hypothetical protein